MRDVYLCCLSLLLTAASYARADVIGPGCATCFGSTYALSYAATSDPNVFDVFLTVDASGFTNTSTDSLNAVSLGLTAKAQDIVSVTLLSAPSTFSATVSGGLNGNGCDGAGPGFFCSGSSANGLPVAAGGDVYRFEWGLTVASASALLTGLDQATGRGALQ